MLVSEMQAFLFCSVFSEQLICTRTQVRHQEYGSKKMRSLAQISLSGFFINSYLLSIFYLSKYAQKYSFSPNFNLPHKHTSKRERKIVCSLGIYQHIRNFSSKCSYLINQSAIVISLISSSCHTLYQQYKSSERENPSSHLMTTSN